MKPGMKPQVWNQSETNNCNLKPWKAIGLKPMSETGVWNHVWNLYLRAKGFRPSKKTGPYKIS